jgi:hypothetical protein
MASANIVDTYLDWLLVPHKRLTGWRRGLGVVELSIEGLKDGNTLLYSFCDAKRSDGPGSKGILLRYESNT